PVSRGVHSGLYYAGPLRGRRISRTFLSSAPTSPARSASRCVTSLLARLGGAVQPLDDLVGDVERVVGVDQPALELAEDHRIAQLLADLVDDRHDLLVD